MAAGIDQPSVSLSRLADRLRALREREYRRLTQEQLASAFGRKNSTVSSWEKPGPDRLPPPDQLAAYARLFCSSRSFASGNPRLLGDDELDDQERHREAELLTELLALRDEVQSAGQTQPREAAVAADEESSSIWRFPDGAAITIVCSDAPERDRPPYADPGHLNYTRFARYADLDALIAVHGHIKAYNPRSDVQIMTVNEFRAEDSETHVVIIGGKAADDPATRLLCSKLLLPKADEEKYKIEHKTWNSHIFRLERENQTFHALFDEDTLIRDIGVFARGNHPVGEDLTVTVCNGITSRGVHGAALCFIGSQRSSKDSQRRVRNERYVNEQLSGASTYCIFMNIQVLRGDAVAPDLSRPGEAWCFKDV